MTQLRSEVFTELEVDLRKDHTSMKTTESKTKSWQRTMCSGYASLSFTPER